MMKGMLSFIHHSSFIISFILFILSIPVNCFHQMTGINLINLGAFDDDGEELNVIIETPKGSRNKFNYDEELMLFKLGGVLPAGAVFPFDFGFVPSTLGGDGDPLDVLVLMDEPAFTGCLVRVRVVGVVEAEQTERDGETTRNDRLIGVAAESRLHSKVRSLAGLNENTLDEIEHFFVSYNEIKGKEFKPLGRFGPARARKVVEEGMRRFSRSKKRSTSKSGKKRSRS
jgi:inorganic pyrophosphatase